MNFTDVIKHPAFDPQTVVDLDKVKARKATASKAVLAYADARDALAAAAEAVAADLRYSFHVSPSTRDEAVADHSIPSAMVKRATTPGDVPAVLSSTDIEAVYAFMKSLHVPAEESPSE